MLSVADTERIWELYRAFALTESHYVFERMGEPDPAQNPRFLAILAAIGRLLAGRVRSRCYEGELLSGDDDEVITRNLIAAGQGHLWDHDHASLQHEVRMLLSGVLFDLNIINPDPEQALEFFDHAAKGASGRPDPSPTDMLDPTVRARLYRGVTGPGGRAREAAATMWMLAGISHQVEYLPNESRLLKVITWLCAVRDRVMAATDDEAVQHEINQMCACYLRRIREIWHTT